MCLVIFIYSSFCSFLIKKSLQRDVTHLLQTLIPLFPNVSLSEICVHVCLYMDVYQCMHIYMHNEVGTYVSILLVLKNMYVRMSVYNTFLHKQSKTRFE